MYRILHKPTGLFYRPSRELFVKYTDPETGKQYSNYLKSNLSKTGKVYGTKPSLQYAKYGVYSHLVYEVNIIRDRLQNVYIPFNEADWEIVPV